MTAVLARPAECPSAASLGDLGAVARPRVLHGLSLCRRKNLTHILGTARGIEGGLGAALELRHHLAGDQLVRALRRRPIGPVVREQEIRAESAIRLLPQLLDLRGAGVRRADGIETGAVDETRSSR
ncbi:hypothetical protein [Bradyrhizobium sp. USDA 336]|uniref:hypothetical protein n=1 Tax=Bradyrhizobium sp. USDA 336 TaxID=3156311 RepID=UPI003833FFCB